MNEELRQICLREMGITEWVSRHDDLQKSELKSEPLSDWESLKEQVKKCTACELHQTRTQTVFGVGNPHADLLFIGEAPGASEDLKGEPFVGRAGQLLNAMLKAINLSREEVYIANILKCRPPNNRDPRPEEVLLCTPFLEQQVSLIQPKLIVALGRIAAHYLLNCATPLHQLRGREYRFSKTDIPLIITYHPAYLLRNPKDKRKAFDDLLKIRALLSS